MSVNMPFSEEEHEKRRTAQAYKLVLTNEKINMLARVGQCTDSIWRVSFCDLLSGLELHWVASVFWICAMVQTLCRHLIPYAISNTSTFVLTLSWLQVFQSTSCNQLSTKKLAKWHIWKSRNQHCDILIVARLSECRVFKFASILLAKLLEASSTAQQKYLPRPATLCIVFRLQIFCFFDLSLMSLISGWSGSGSCMK